mgnify:CR=1 FL=1
MAKKYILSESAVRRFQKLAKVKPINEMYGMKHDDAMEEAYDLPMEEAEEEAEVEMDVEAPPMDEPPMDEPEMDEPAGADAAEDMARNVIMAVADALGVEIDIDAGEAADEPAMDEPEEEVMEEEVVEEEALEEMAHADAVEEMAHADTVKEMDHGDTLEEVEMIDEDALTEAVMKRVLGRLKEMTAKSKKS